MTQTELKDYRLILEKEYSGKDSEIESSLTYISVMALGFFITMNEKFIDLQHSDSTLLLVISLFFLFLTFIIILVRKSKAGRVAHRLITFVDSIEPNNEDQDRGLLKLWEKENKSLSLLMNLAYISLSVGIGLQVLFLGLNIVIK